MKKPKVTPWFNCREHKPVRPGLYEVRFGENDRDSMLYRFNGGRWRECLHPDGGVTPATEDSRPGWSHEDQWRGLTEPING